MISRLFVDTGAWYALVDRNDPDHKTAAAFIRSNDLPLITTNFVFDETVTLIRNRIGLHVAGDFGRKLRDSSFVTLSAVKDADEERAWEIFLKYKDSDFSYTDCTSFAFMERFRLAAAFSFDRHFRTMRFQVVPM